MRKRKAKKTVAIIVSGMEFSIWLHVYLYSCKLYNMQCLAVEDKCPKLQCCIWDIHVICTHIVIINWYFQSRRIGILNQHIRYSPNFLDNSVHITVYLVTKVGMKAMNKPMNA